jgi:hypothetical protein
LSQKSLILILLAALTSSIGPSGARASQDRYFDISDLDDTAKMTNVLSLRQMLYRTFFAKKAFAGMPLLYQELEAHRIAEHPEHAEADRMTFVSNSPTFLSGPFAKTLSKLGFPETRLALRDWFNKPKREDLGNHPIRIHPLADRSRFISKFLAAEKRIHENGARARVDLIGDDTELDYEIYKALKELHPERIGRIYIHKVQGRADIDPAIATVFQDAFELALLKFNDGKLSSEAAARVGVDMLRTIDRDRLSPDFVRPETEVRYPETPGASEDVEALKHAIARRIESLNEGGVSAPREAFMIREPKRPAEVPAHLRRHRVR